MFKIGEKVVCVISTGTQTKGNIYYIIWEHTFKCGTQIVQTNGHFYIGKIQRRAIVDVMKN